ncbi:MAG: hypothetical protein ACLVDB_04755 [Anaeromassilibacillus sp.]
MFETVEGEHHATHASKCPHCGKQVNWFRAWALKTQGNTAAGNAANTERRAG